MCLKQEHKLRFKNTNPEIKKKKKNREHNSRYKKERKKHPHTHFLSYAQTHSKKQHLDLKCNNTNNASLSLSLFSQKCYPNNSNRSQEPKSNPKATKQNTRSPSILTHLAMVELKQKILGITS